MAKPLACPTCGQAPGQQLAPWAKWLIKVSAATLAFIVCVFVCVFFAGFVILVLNAQFHEREHGASNGPAPVEVEQR